MPNQKKIQLFSLVFILCLCVLLGYKGVSASPDEAEETRTADSLRRVTKHVRMEATWPTLGVERIDEEIQALIEKTTTDFEKAALDEEKESLEMKKTDPDAFTPRFPYECLITYDRSSPMPEKSRVESVVWNISTFTGGAIL